MDVKYFFQFNNQLVNVPFENYKNQLDVNIIKRSFFNSNKSLMQTVFIHCCCVK